MPPRKRAASVVNNRAVTREIGRVVWPALREAGFDSFTGRSAWRYIGDDIDVVNFQSFGGMLADSVGCTSFSFQLNLGLFRPSDALVPPREHDAQGRPRPQEYECEPHRTHLQKSLAQPWFTPFQRETRRWPSSFRIHREGLKRVLRIGTHDVAEIWFVLPDGSNVEECIDDSLRALQGDGLAWFDALRC